MRRRRSIEVACLAALAVCGPLAGAETTARPAAPGEEVRYARPDAETIRAEIRDVLADPRLAPRPKTVWQRISAWIVREFKDLLGRAGGSPGTWGRAVFWVLISWCVLTLLAILAHMAWTIAAVVTARRGGQAARRADGRFRAERPATCEQLEEMMRRAAEKGEFREAIRLMMLSMLDLLDRAGAVRVREGKTNGDYVREYRPGGRGREAFRRFVLAFDEAVYGAGPCDRRTYRDLDLRFNQARVHATQG